MSSAWSLSVVLFAVFLGAKALPLEDDPLVEKVKAIVTHVDEYLATHGLNALILPDIGVFSIDPVKLRNGRFGEFSTIYVQDATSVKKTQLDDGVLYNFDVNLGLDDLRVRYDFDINAIVIKEKGNFSLSVLKNSAQLVGSVTVLNNKVCEAKLTNVKFVQLDDYRIEVPGNRPALIVVSEVLLNQIGPMLVPLLNTALRAALLVPGAQNVFSAIACSELSIS